MWMPSQSSHAVNPPCLPSGPSHGRCRSPRQLRPMTATSPRFGSGTARVRAAVEPRPPILRARACRPASRPGRRPAWPARASTAAWPRRRRRGSRGDRAWSGRADEHPPVAVRLGADRGSRPVRANDDASTPGAPTGPSARAISSEVPPGVRPPADRDDAVLVDVGDPGADPDLDAEPLELALRRRRSVRAGSVGRMRSIASTRMIRAAAGRIDAEVAAQGVARDLASVDRRARRRSARRRRARTSSTPRRRSGSASRSAASNAMRIRRRISVASSMVLRPGAHAPAHSSCPK